VEFLQVLRAREPLGGTWQPVMGHCEEGETAVACAVREMREELGLEAREAVGVWALEQTWPFYVAAVDCVMASPRFAVEVAAGWRPRLNDESREFRWVGAGEVGARFAWPGQRMACEEILRELASGAGVSRELLRVRIG
jgi:8-oxo-dGTP pyrophosphatase MutT (NUDIX family)